MREEGQGKTVQQVEHQARHREGWCSGRVMWGQAISGRIVLSYVGVSDDDTVTR